MFYINVLANSDMGNFMRVPTGNWRVMVAKNFNTEHPHKVLWFQRPFLVIYKVIKDVSNNNRKALEAKSSPESTNVIGGLGQANDSIT